MRVLTIILLTILLLTKVTGTEQVSDILIIGEDTFYLKTFPLESLGFEKSPYKASSTGCWRGYIATWSIVDNKLTLEQVEKASPPYTLLNTKEYLISNNHIPKLSDGKIVADWYSEELTLYSPPFGHGCECVNFDNIYLGSFSGDKVILKIKEGIVTENVMKNLKKLSIGDTLVYKLEKYSNILNRNKDIVIEGTISEVKNKAIKLEIYSYGVDKKKTIEKIKLHIHCNSDENEIEINPLYWDKKNGL